MRALLALALLLPLSAARAQDDEKLSIQPHLVGLHLGDSLRKVKRVYPPARDWPSTHNEKRNVTRYRLSGADTKSFPAHVRALYLGFHWGDLVEIEVVYDDDYSRKETYERLAGDYALMYGSPRRSGDRFWWDDGSVVLRVFPAEVPLGPDGQIVSSTTVPSPSSDDADSVAWRTGVQIFRRSIFSD
jgi:hypothetical protein